MAEHTGQQLGNYRLVRLLGRGGFAEVYLGEHIRLNTQAAIKVRYEQFSKDDAEEFLKEAQTIANLVHPHIVRIFDFDVHDGVPFLVMDYAPNGTLRQRYPKNTRVPLEAIISHIKQITDALQYAHDEKFMHRDIKPDNMLLGRRNDILLSDFGLALVAQSTRQQSLQELGGTAYYMAPEQLRGKPRQASDQYALGVVVYEWLTGERPFNGSFSEVASQHIFEPPPPIHEKLPSISPAVEEVVMTALAKDPHQRFGSVRSFANALEQASKVSGSFPGAHVASQPPVAEPQPVYPAQGTAHPPLSPNYPEQQPVAPPQPVYPAQGQQQTPSLPNNTVTAPPASPNYLQQPPADTSMNANAQSGYSQPVSEQKGTTSDQYRAPGSQPIVTPQKKRRTGLIIGLIAALLLLVGAGIGGYYYINLSTPEKTLTAACTAITNNDAQGFFNLLSSHAQSQTNVATVAQQLQQFQTPQAGGVKSCSYSIIQQSGSNATALLMLTFGHASPSSFNFTLVKENDTWKVDSIASA